MKHLLLLLLVMSVSCEIHIEHGDKQNTTSEIHNNPTDIRIFTYQKDDDAKYVQKNNVTGAEVTLKVPDKKSKDDVIVSSILILRKDGTYKFSYSTSNFTAREENSKLVKDSSETDSLKVDGSFAYTSTGPKRIRYIQSYTADKNGFRTKVAFGTKLPIQEEVIGGDRNTGTTATPKKIGACEIGSFLGGGCR